MQTKEVEIFGGTAENIVIVQSSVSVDFWNDIYLDIRRKILLYIFSVVPDPDNASFVSTTEDNSNYKETPSFFLLASVSKEWNSAYLESEKARWRNALLKHIPAFIEQDRSCIPYYTAIFPANFFSSPLPRSTDRIKLSLQKLLQDKDIKEVEQRELEIPLICGFIQIRSEKSFHEKFFEKWLELILNYLTHPLILRWLTGEALIWLDRSTSYDYWFWFRKNLLESFVEKACILFGNIERNAKESQQLAAIESILQCLTATDWEKCIELFSRNAIILKAIKNGYLLTPEKVTAKSLCLFINNLYILHLTGSDYYKFIEHFISEKMCDQVLEAVFANWPYCRNKTDFEYYKTCALALLTQWQDHVTEDVLKALFKHLTFFVRSTFDSQYFETLFGYEQISKNVTSSVLKEVINANSWRFQEMFKENSWRLKEAPFEAFSSLITFLTVRFANLMTKKKYWN